jgi:hypothetical protein
LGGGGIPEYAEVLNQFYHVLAEFRGGPQEVVYNVFAIVEEKGYGFPVIDKAGETTVRAMFGAIRQAAGEFYETFPAGVGIIP